MRLRYKRSLLHPYRARVKISEDEPEEVRVLGNVLLYILPWFPFYINESLRNILEIIFTTLIISSIISVFLFRDFDTQFPPLKATKRPLELLIQRHMPPTPIIEKEVKPVPKPEEPQVREPKEAQDEKPPPLSANQIDTRPQKAEQQSPSVSAEDIGLPKIINPAREGTGQISSIIGIPITTKREPGLNVTLPSGGDIEKVGIGGGEQALEGDDLPGGSDIAAPTGGSKKYSQEPTGLGASTESDKRGRSDTIPTEVQHELWSREAYDQVISDPDPLKGIKTNEILDSIHRIVLNIKSSAEFSGVEIGDAELSWVVIRSGEVTIRYVDGVIHHYKIERGVDHGFRIGPTERSKRTRELGIYREEAELFQDQLSRLEKTGKLR